METKIKQTSVFID